MKYMGSKNRHAKEILPIILNDRTQDQFYVEPFMGGCNSIDKVGGNRIANDIHPHLVVLFKAIVDGWEPPNEISETEYHIARNSKELTPLVGFIGFGCSYSSKWFGGYARGNDANGLPRNYALETKKNLLSQRDKLRNVEFHNVGYDQFSIPNNSIIYCDPPYQGTTNYKTGNFNHYEFWNWCREKEKEGHSVFVSEYSAPEDFEILWSKKVNNTLVKNTGSKQGVEKLFRLKNVYL